jgi:VWFA-related protein
MSEGGPNSGRRSGGGWPGGGGGYPGGGGGNGRRGGGGEDRKSQIDGKKIMTEIATRTGGRYFEAKKKDSLEEIYNAIAEELRGQYLLTYTPDKAANDEEFHKVALKAKNADLTVVTREGYYAAK